MPTTRHAFTITIEIESDCTDRATVANALLQHATSLQGETYESAEVLPGGAETGQTVCTVSVAWAEVDGARSEPYWATAWGDGVPPGLEHLHRPAAR